MALQWTIWPLPEPTTQQLVGLPTLEHRFAVTTLTAFSPISPKDHCTSPFSISVGLKAICRVKAVPLPPQQSSRRLVTPLRSALGGPTLADAAEEGELASFDLVRSANAASEGSKNLPCSYQIGPGTCPYSERHPLASLCRTDNLTSDNVASQPLCFLSFAKLLWITVTLLCGLDPFPCLYQISNRSGLFQAASVTPRNEAPFGVQPFNLEYDALQRKKTTWQGRNRRTLEHR